MIFKFLSYYCLCGGGGACTEFREHLSWDLQMCISGMKQIVIAGNTLVVVFVNSFRLGSIITSGRSFG